MPMTVETALITRKGIQAEFNTDSVNASGKTWDRDVIHGEKGIKAVGTGRDVPYYVLASSPYKGTAESAADLFKSCTEIFSSDMQNCPSVISEFYISFAKVLKEAGFASSDCELSVFCGYGNTVHIAKSGNAKLFRFTKTEFTEIEATQNDFSDGNSSFGVCSFPNTAVGDIFIMLNGNASAVLPNDLVGAICRSSGGDIKKLISIISAQADKYGCKGAVSAIVVKVTETDACTIMSASENIVA